MAAPFIDPLAMALHLLATADAMQRQGGGVESLERARVIYSEAFRVLVVAIPPATYAAGVAYAPSFEVGSHPLPNGIDVVYSQLANIVEQRLLITGLIHSAECSARIVHKRIEGRAEFVHRAAGLSVDANECLLLACTLTDGEYAAQVAAAQADDPSRVVPSESLQQIFDMIAMIQVRREQDLVALQRLHDRLSRAIQPLDDSGAAARARMGEERWNANKPREERCSLAQQRATLHEQIEAVVKLREEVTQAALQLAGRQSRPPPSMPPAGAGAGAGVGDGPNRGGGGGGGRGGRGRGRGRGGRGGRGGGGGGGGAPAGPVPAAPAPAAPHSAAAAAPGGGQRGGHGGREGRGGGGGRGRGGPAPRGGGQPQ